MIMNVYLHVWTGDTQIVFTMAWESSFKDEACEQDKVYFLDPSWSF